MKTATEIITQLQKTLLDEFKLDSFVKGSYGYGAPRELSDIDIQIYPLSPVDFKLENLVERYGATVSAIDYTDSLGRNYISSMLDFTVEGIAISLIYDNSKEIFDQNRAIVETISKLEPKERYILRAISGGLKYDSPEAYQLFLRIWKRLSPVLDKELVESIESGNEIDASRCARIRKVCNLVYANEVGVECKLSIL